MTEVVKGLREESQSRSAIPNRHETPSSRRGGPGASHRHARCEGTTNGGREGDESMRATRTRRTTLLLLGLCMLTLCASCGEPPPVDRSLLTGEPCEPPCWQGLTPGESTLQDVNEFTATSRFVHTRTVSRSSHTRLTQDGEEVARVSIRWRSSAGLRKCNSFLIEDGVLTRILICHDPGLTLRNLIDRYGPPEKYVAGLTFGGPLYYEVTLFYPTYGFTAELVAPYDDGTLQPESRVTSVWYFPAAPLERFLQLSYDAGYGGPPAKSLEVLRDWPGYGPIEIS